MRLRTRTLSYLAILEFSAILSLIPPALAVYYFAPTHPPVQPRSPQIRLFVLLAGPPGMFGRAISWDTIYCDLAVSSARAGRTSAWLMYLDDVITSPNRHSPDRPEYSLLAIEHLLVAVPFWFFFGLVVWEAAHFLAHRLARKRDLPTQ